MPVIDDFRRGEQDEARTMRSQAVAWCNMSEYEGRGRDDGRGVLLRRKKEAGVAPALLPPQPITDGLIFNLTRKLFPPFGVNYPIRVKLKQSPIAHASLIHDSPRVYHMTHIVPRTCYCAIRYQDGLGFC